MASRTIGQQLPTSGEKNRRCGGRRRVTVVVADSGADAEVLVFPAVDGVTVGAEFHHRGMTWIVTGLRHDSRILVAEPASH